MLRHKIQLETKTATGEHTYQCEPNVPLTEVYEAINTFRAYVYGRLKEAEEQQKASQPTEKAEQPQG